MEIKTRTKKWGGSLAIVIPKEVTQKEHIHENDIITVEVKKAHPVSEFFGLFPEWKTPTQKLKDEMKKGWN